MYELLDTSNHAKCIEAVATYFRGDAASWWKFQSKEIAEGRLQPYTDWYVFKADMLRVFQPADLVKSSRDRLDKLHQIGSVGSYVRELRKTTLLIPDLSEGYLVHRFVRGLKSAIQTEVDLRGPVPLAEAMQQAERADGIMMTIQKGNFRPFGKRNVERSGNGPRPMELGNMNVRPVNNGRFADVTCFNCGKKGHIARFCKSPKQEN